MSKWICWNIASILNFELYYHYPPPSNLLPSTLTMLTNFEISYEDFELIFVQQREFRQIGLDAVN